MKLKKRYLIVMLPWMAGLLAFINADTQKERYMERANGGSNHSQVQSQEETATLGGGCFWCLEAIYERLKGVEKVVSGYAGGTIAHPTYEQVCSGSTGHAEVTQVIFNPQIISYKELLEVFFDIHDPTSLNRQGADIGTQYRSVIFYHTPVQEQVAKTMIKEMTEEHVYSQPIVTQVVPFKAFYPAEKYHQDYFSRNANQPYCSFVISPKVKKFEKKYKEQLKNSKQ